MYSFDDIGLICVFFGDEKATQKNSNTNKSILKNYIRTGRLTWAWNSLILLKFDNDILFWTIYITVQIDK